METVLHPIAQCLNPRTLLIVFGLFLASACVPLPQVTDIEVIGNDIKAMHGSVDPGKAVLVEFRAREMEAAPLPAGVGFDCWLTHGSCWDSSWGSVGLAWDTDNNGRWSLSNAVGLLPTSIIRTPSSVWANDGYYVEFRLTEINTTNGNSRVPDKFTVLESFDLKQVTTGGGAKQAFAEIRAHNVDRLVLGVADGPEDTGGPPSTGDDKDYDGVVFEDPSTAYFRQFTSGAYPPPWINVGVGFTPLNNPEYPFVLAMAMGSRAGHAFLATTVEARAPEPWLEIDVSGSVTADAAINISLCLTLNDIPINCW